MILLKKQCVPQDPKTYKPLTLQSSEPCKNQPSKSQSPTWNILQQFLRVLTYNWKQKRATKSRLQKKGRWRWRQTFCSLLTSACSKHSQDTACVGAFSPHRFHITCQREGKLVGHMPVFYRHIALQTGPDSSPFSPENPKHNVLHRRGSLLQLFLALWKNPSVRNLRWTFTKQIVL